VGSTGTPATATAPGERFGATASLDVLSRRVGCQLFQIALEIGTSHA
jgi:hypothetical protein